MATGTWSFKDDFWFTVTFIYRESTDKPVYLVGDFNGWRDKANEYKMAPCDEGLSVSVLLREGYYHYKYSVDGHLVRDRANPHIGGMYDNSIMFVNMDPGVYGLKNQDPPFREHHPVGGAEFITLNPIPPPELLSQGILQRLVFLYLPPSYATSVDKRYPVVYAHDGQNLFSTPEDRGGPPWGGWYLDAKLDWEWSQGTLPEFILVAIPNSDYVCIGNRHKEYTCSDINRLTDEPYVQYITQFLKPLIDNEYRTVIDESHIMGASLGGLMAFLLASSLPSGVFKSCACLSPALWFVDKHNQSCFSLLESKDITNRLKSIKVYIDSGDGEGDNKEVVKDMADMLNERGLSEGCEYKYVYDQCKDRAPCGVTHSEWVWRERIVHALKFILL